jgi:predicted GIY-YIG superfamily endonuclease
MKHKQRSTFCTFKHGHKNMRIAACDKARLEAGSRHNEIAPYFFYCLTITGKLRYFGITNNPKTRFRAHLSGTAAKTHKDAVIRKAIRQQAPIVMVLLKACKSVAEAEGLESRMIRFFRTAYRLCNSAKVKPEHKTIARYGRYNTRRRKDASERGRRMANRRWELEGQRRDRLAAACPLARVDQIVRRIIVVDREETVRETTIYAFDSFREARRKARKVLAHSPILELSQKTP